MGNIVGQNYTPTAQQNAPQYWGMPVHTIADAFYSLSARASYDKFNMANLASGFQTDNQEYLITRTGQEQRDTIRETKNKGGFFDQLGSAIAGGVQAAIPIVVGSSVGSNGLVGIGGQNNSIIPRYGSNAGFTPPFAPTNTTRQGSGFDVGSFFKNLFGSSAPKSSVPTTSPTSGYDPSDWLKNAGITL